MREIKFRAWDKTLSYMHKGSQYISMWVDKNGVLYNEELIYMQATPFKDKKKQEVFEGDIIQTAEIRWVVSFGTPASDDRGFGWIATSLNTKISYWLDKSICKGRVIGNIYENPELLQ